VRAVTMTKEQGTAETQDDVVVIDSNMEPE
jgi:hypothetical protein